jgi:hypothetical protein
MYADTAFDGEFAHHGAMAKDGAGGVRDQPFVGVDQGRCGADITCTPRPTWEARGASMWRFGRAGRCFPIGAPTGFLYQQPIGWGRSAPLPAPTGFLCGSMFVGLWLFANRAERYVDRGLSRNAVFRDRLGDIRSRRATVSSPLRHGALAYLTKKLASVSGHSRCSAVAQLAVMAEEPLMVGGSFNNRPARVALGRMRGPGADLRAFPNGLPRAQPDHSATRRVLSR